MPKGIYIRTEEVKKRLRLLRKGKISWNKGKTPSDETKRKLRLANIGKKASEETKQKMRLSHKREKAYNWKGGISPFNVQIRGNTKYKQWRSDIFIRDNFTCKKCGKIGGKLEAHHKKPFHKFIEEIKINLPLLDLYEGVMTYTPLWNLENGITLCKSCHKKINTRR